MKNVYFIRHNFGDARKNGKEDELRKILRTNNCIAIHFNDEEPADEEWEDAINRAEEAEDAEKKRFVKAAKIFRELKKDGGYVLTQYETNGDFLIVKIEPGTRICYLKELSESNNSNFKGFKCLKFSKFKVCRASEVPLLLAVRPIQQTIARMVKGQKVVLNIFDGKKNEQDIAFLTPKIQELLVQEWLRSSDAKKLQIKYQVILTGKSYPFYDIIGRTILGKKLFAQVTYHDLSTKKSKFLAFQKLASKANENQVFVMFSREKSGERNGVIFKDLNEVLKDLLKSNAEFIEEVFQGATD